ncbi:TPA: hypothetical protein ON570_004914 [Citrobacter werkmanii]|nr:hypothetical protein [Citrobacter werkmanii]
MASEIIDVRQAVRKSRGITIPAWFFILVYTVCLLAAGISRTETVAFPVTQGEAGAPGYSCTAPETERLSQLNMCLSGYSAATGPQRGHDDMEKKNALAGFGVYTGYSAWL